MYAPAMKYSLPAVAVDEEELDRIQSKIIPTIVQRLGLNSKLPTAVRYGPTELGGLGLMDLRTEGGLEMIRYFRHSVYKNSQVGQLLLLSLQTSQLESGLPNRLLEETSIEIPYLTTTWILSMRQYMYNHNISIKVNSDLVINLLSPKDDYIMSIKRLKTYAYGQQTDINLVRIYLQVSTIGEVSDPQDFKRISRDALQAIRPATFVNNSGWPRQLQPSKEQI